jgi:hypothetical protein
MTGLEILDRIRDLGVEVELIGDWVQVTPLAKVPSDLMAEAKAHKAEIVRELTPTYSDGQPPPLDRPPTTEQELRRLMDHTADSENFAKWLERAMNHTDPSESFI